MRDPRPFLHRHRTGIGVAAVVALLALGFAALEALTREIHFADVRAAVHALSAGRIALAVLATAGSYLALTFYDRIALEVIGRPLPWRTAALASFTSYTLSHNLGLSLLTGGSARYRIYSAAGLDGPDVARVVAIASGTFWAGVVTVGGMALLLHDGALDLAGLRLDAGATTPAGAAILGLAALLLVACAVVRRPVRLFGFGIPLSGIEDRRLAPAWAKAAGFVFRHGERFYGFRGLRTYKDKFAPSWEPRYIAGPTGIGLLRSLRDLSRLIGHPPAPVPLAPTPPVEEALPS